MRSRFLKWVSVFLVSMLVLRVSSAITPPMYPLETLPKVSFVGVVVPEAGQVTRWSTDGSPCEVTYEVRVLQSTGKYPERLSVSMVRSPYLVQNPVALGERVFIIAAALEEHQVFPLSDGLERLNPECATAPTSGLSMLSEFSARIQSERDLGYQAGSDAGDELLALGTGVCLLDLPGAERVFWDNRDRVIVRREADSATAASGGLHCQGVVLEDLMSAFSYRAD